MEPAAAKGVTPEIVTEEIVATTEEIVTEVKEEVIEALLGCAKSSADWRPCGAAQPSSSTRPPSFKGV